MEDFRSGISGVPAEIRLCIEHGRRTATDRIADAAKIPQGILHLVKHEPFIADRA